MYKIDVIVIPTNRPLQREDEHDSVYKTEDAKFNAVINDAAATHEKVSLVLIGTVSIEKPKSLVKCSESADQTDNVLIS